MSDKRDLDDPDHPHVAGHAQLEVLAAARFDREHIAVDGFDGAANPRRRRRLLGDRTERRRGDHGDGDKRAGKRGAMNGHEMVSAGVHCNHGHRSLARYSRSSLCEIGLDQRAKFRRHLGALSEPEFEPAHRLMQQHAEPVGGLQSARPRRRQAMAFPAAHRPGRRPRHAAAAGRHRVRARAGRACRARSCSPANRRAAAGRRSSPMRREDPGAELIRQRAAPARWCGWPDARA